MQEKRRCKRINKNFMSWFRTIKVILAKRYPSKWDMVTARDLSANGMLFNYNNNIDVGTDIHFRIIFPFAAHVIRCIGKVVRKNKPRKYSNLKIFHIAAEFEKIKKKDRDLINAVADEVC